MACFRVKTKTATENIMPELEKIICLYFSRTFVASPIPDFSRTMVCIFVSNALPNTGPYVKAAHDYNVCNLGFLVVVFDSNLGLCIYRYVCTCLCCIDHICIPLHLVSFIRLWAFYVL